MLRRDKLLAQVPSAMARSHYLKAVVPRATDGELDVLAAPFYGPLDGRDEHGEYFSPRTEFQSELIPYPPVFYYHGAETGNSAAAIGRTSDRWEDNLGVWFRVGLDLTQPEARRVWQAAQVGNAYASTGGVGASIITDSTGEIRQWLIGEISLFDMDDRVGRMPANRYAIAMPRMKALLDALPQAQRRLFDEVYQAPDGAQTSGGGARVDVIEILQAIFARVIEELATAMNTTPADAAATVDEAVSAAMDAADTTAASTELTDETKCADCKANGCQGEDCAGCKGCGSPEDDKKSEGEVDGAVAEIIDALDLDDGALDTKARALKALVSQNAALRSKLAEREDGDWLKTQLTAFKIVPADVDATLRALRAARAADARSKAANQPTVAAIKTMIEARPAQFTKRDLSGKGLKLAGFQTDKQTQERVDVAYMQRVRRLAGLPESE